MKHKQTNVTESALKTVVKGAGLVLIGVIVSKLLGYVFRLIVASGTDAAYYGKFNIAFSFVSIIATVAALGIPTGLTKYVSDCVVKKDMKKARTYVRDGFWLMLLLAIIFTAGVVLFSDNIAAILGIPNEGPLIMIMALFIIVESLMGITTPIFRATDTIKYFVIIQRIVMSILRAVGAVIVVVWGLSVFHLGMLWVIATAIALVLSYIVIQRKVMPIIGQKFAVKSTYLQLLSYSAPLLLYGFMAIIIGQIDSLILGHFRGDEITGIYNAGLPTAQLLATIPIAIRFIFFPVMTKLIALKKNKEFKDVYKVVNKWILMINLPITAVFVLFSSQILTIFFGAEYSVGALSFIILSIGFLIFSLSFPAIDALNAISKTKLTLIISVSATIINVILNFVLIPKYGMIGAAVATSIAYIVIMLMGCIILYNKQKAQPFSIYNLKIVVATAIPTAILYFVVQAIPKISIPWIAALVIGFCVVYLGLLIIMKSFEKNDIMIISAVAKKTGIKLQFLKRFT